MIWIVVLTTFVLQESASVAPTTTIQVRPTSETAMGAGFTVISTTGVVTTTTDVERKTSGVGTTTNPGAGTEFIALVASYSKVIPPAQPTTVLACWDSRNDRYVAYTCTWKCKAKQHHLSERDGAML